MRLFLNLSTVRVALVVKSAENTRSSPRDALTFHRASTTRFGFLRFSRNKKIHSVVRSKHEIHQKTKTKKDLD